MAKVRARPETGKLYFDFFYRGTRCREQTDLPDTPANRKRVEAVMRRIETEMQQGTFDYSRYFPNNKLPKRAEERHRIVAGEESALGRGDVVSAPVNDAPTFAAFLDIWLTENEVRWRRTTKKLRRETIQLHLMPTYGERAVNTITRA